MYMPNPRRALRKRQSRKFDVKKAAAAFHDLPDAPGRTRSNVATPNGVMGTGPTAGEIAVLTFAAQNPTS
jgi:hypothetical protein